MPLESGQVLGPYEILGPVGAGTMGDVYRARDNRLEREVAIKVLPGDLVHDAERLLRFEREARTLASLNHPNVAQVFGIDRVEDTSYMAMELVPGEDLAKRLARGPLPVTEAIDVARQIAEGVEAAHEARVIHRDLKPANICVTSQGRVKVLDFGLSKRTAVASGEDSAMQSGLSTEAGRLLGTPTYMAPEQVRGKPIDRRVDVWAFGCVLYECLTARRAFAGNTLSDVLASVLEKEPDLSTLPSSTPASLRRLIGRCLCKDSRRRLRDIGEARLLLEDLAAGRTLEEPRTRSRPLRPLLAGLLLGGTAIWLWGDFMSTHESQPRIEAVNQLTFEHAWATGSSWSEQGERIAYSEVTNQGFDIFVKPVKGGEPDLRVDGPGDDLSPRISPNGQLIAYVTSGERGSPIRLVNTQGGTNSTHVVDTGIFTLDLNSMLLAMGDRPWSPDSQSLLASIRDENGRLAIHRVNVLTGSKEILTHPGPGEEDLAASLSFHESPADQYIVFQRRSGGSSDLWWMPVNGRDAATPLLANDFADQNPCWRPDHQRIVFRRSTSGGSFNIWELHIPSGETRQITKETRRVWTIAVAGDDRIGFAPSDHDTFLYRVGREGDEPPLRLNQKTGDNFGARPSPVGGSIAYHSSRTGDTEIWLLEQDGNELQLSHESTMEIFPDWSPDGRFLSYISDSEGPFKVFIQELDRAGRRRLVDQPVSVHGSNNVNATVLARWSPDVQDPRIAYIVSGDPDKDLWTVRADGSDPTEVLQSVFSFDWFLDNRRGVAVLTELDGTLRLWAVDLVTKDRRLLLDEPCTEIDVAPDGTAVSFVAGPSHTLMNLYVLPLEMPDGPAGLPQAADEPVQRTFGRGRYHVHNGGWTADSQFMVYTRDEDYGDIFELIETP